ncbi:MAG: phosphoribosyltransferase family protein [Rubrivivax sp.]
MKAGAAAPMALARRVAHGLPGQCEICRRWGWERLCRACRQHFAVERLRCARCGLATGAALAACGACLQAPPPFARTVVALDYAFPWDGIIGRWKFGARPELASPLALLLAQAAARDLAPRAADAPALVLPVPLASARLAERGFNQAWELARRVARGLGLPARSALLARAIDTAHQAELTRAERERNLRAAFTVPPAGRQALAGRRVALVDDVLTTGATAREASAALLRAGAAAVELWVLARTPAPQARP